MSASADHIKAMVRSHTSGDHDAFYAVALQVAARAARQGHQRLADDLKALVEDARQRDRGASIVPIAKPRGDIADLVTASFPATRLRDLMAPPQLHKQLVQVLHEQRQRHMLVEQGFHPIHRLLLEGPPGTGKTMTAAVLAHELDLPLLTVRLDAIFSKYLGETGSKLRLLFDSVGAQRAVYLFDEFDALGGDRAGNDVGEARRVLNSFLVFLENANAESLVVAATNHSSLLDRALFRRFDIVLRYCRPDEVQAVAVLKSRLGPLGRGIAWKSVAAHVDGLSHADLVKCAEAAAKAALLAGRRSVNAEGLVAAIENAGVGRYVDGMEYNVFAAHDDCWPA